MFPAGRIPSSSSPVPQGILLRRHGCTLSTRTPVPHSNGELGNLAQTGGGSKSCPLRYELPEAQWNEKNRYNSFLLVLLAGKVPVSKITDQGSALCTIDKIFVALTFEENCSGRIARIIAIIADFSFRRYHSVLGGIGSKKQAYLPGVILRVMHLVVTKASFDVEAR